jgi:hypothetical protein
MVRALCEQQAPNKKALFLAMRALGDMHHVELQPESRSEAALGNIKTLLGCGRHDSGADDVHLLASRLRFVFLEAVELEAPSMNMQDVAQTVWALAKLNMPPAGSLRHHLWAAAEREAPSMHAQHVADMMWALAKINMPPAGSLCDALET